MNGRTNIVAAERQRFEDEKLARAMMTDLHERETTQRSKAFAHYLVTGDDYELKALQMNIDQAGGYLAGPAFREEFIRAEAEASPLVGMVRMLPGIPSGDTLHLPAQDSLLDLPTWTSELLISADDSSQPFGARVFSPSPLAKAVKVSKKLLRQSTIAETVIRESIAEVHASALELAFISGTGANQPLGILNTPGLPTYTTAGAGALVVGDIDKWLFGLKARYQNSDSVAILCHPDFLAQAAQLDDARLKVGKGTLRDFRVVLSDRFPTAGQALTSLTSGTFLACVGDWSQYVAVPSLDFSIQVLTELLAATNQNYYLARQEIDGGAVVANAFRALKVQ